MADFEICHPDHFKALAIFAANAVHPLHCGFDRMNAASKETLATAYADTLYQENIRSIRSRYPERTWNDLPGLGHMPLHIVVTSREMADPSLKPDIISILKMCDCLEFVSRENEDYWETPAYLLLRSIRSEAISRLDGYEDACWMFSR